jgi:DNA topoisomerase IA
VPRNFRAKKPHCSERRDSSQKELRSAMTGVRKGKAKPCAVVQEQKARKKARRQLLYKERRLEREAQKALRVSNFYC